MHLSPETAARLLRGARISELKAPLTPRELGVLRLLTAGRANKEIALELGIGEATVKSHVGRILAKLGVQSRAQAAIHAIRNGLIPAAALGVLGIGQRVLP